MSLADAMSKLAQKTATTAIGIPTASRPTPSADGEPVLRVKQLAPPGTDLWPDHPARLAKKD